MEYYDLTTPQQNIWNLQKLYEDSAISNLCGTVFFQEEYDIDILKKALNHILEKQTGLRLHFTKKDGKVKQYVKSYSYTEFPVRYFTDEAEFETYAMKAARQPIGLIECDMFRMEIIRIGFKTGVLVVLSHLISDAWSFSLLIRKVNEVYQNMKYDIEQTEEVSDYIDYVRTEKKYLDSDKFKKDNSYWKEKYCTKPEISSMKIKSAQVKFIKANRFIKKLPEIITKRLREYCAFHQITPAVLFETALNVYLYKINPDNQTITIGIPVLNRTKVWEKNTAGMFISTMPLTIDISENDSIEHLTEKITLAHAEVFRHQKYPYSMILKHLREKQNFEGNLYHVMFSFQNAETNTEAVTKWYSNGYSEVPFTLHVDNRDKENTYTLTADYQTEIFKEEKEVENIIERLEYILEQIIDNPTADVKDISIIPEKELNKILYAFNDTAVDYPRDKCVHELFMEQAAKTPERIAVVFEDKEITYRELDELSNVLARLLREKGVKRGDIVPIIAQRSYYIPVAMLGILKAGAAYMPIAPDYPKDRVQFIIEEAKSRIGCVLGYEETLESIELWKLDELGLWEAEPEKRLPIENVNEPEDLCYVIFTSGSTGVPKGVMIRHENVRNYSHNNNNNNVCHAVIQEGYQKIISVTNIVFDIFVTESILSLLNGMTVYFTNDDEVFSQSDINRIITENGIEVLQTTPTKMKGYLFDKTQKEYLSVLKVIILGGEALTAGLYEELRKQTGAEIFNIYGPAETTVWSSNAKVENTDITIGKPIANTQIYILDKTSRPVPIGVPGELCIAGDGVGKGYLNRPDLTAERFVENPFATEENGHGKVMYHTRDLAAWREDGKIEYLGRIDTQVKIRGLRIELGEIESVMSEFPGIRMCAVTDKKDEEGRQYLVGYYTTVSDGKENQNIMTAVHVDEKALREHLMAKLPKYMVPNYFMHLKEIPMTPSGKTDRKNLPVPNVGIMDFTEYIVPVTEQEKKICQAIEKVLDYSPIGLSHDFFAYGGDSLKAIELVVQLESMGFKPKLQEVFEHPVVNDLIQVLQNGTEEKAERVYSPEQFEKYAMLLGKNKTGESVKLCEMPIKTVLLSGITGFLGAHIADALLQDEECIIYCLVRSKSTEDRRGRFPEILKYYFGDKYTDVIGTRIIPIVGDITWEQLSDELPGKVDMVIHAAATVKHYGTYEYFYKVNTLGTKHMADYARRIGAKFIHISTISVSGNSLADSFDTEIASEERIFGEDCLYQKQSLQNVYVRSKFEAECVVLDAMLQGLQANIIRVGNLTNRSRDYRFQPNYTENAFLSRIKAIMDLKCIPDYMLPLYIEFSPVDDTADAIVRIARHFSGEHTVFHVYSDKNLYFDRMLEILKQLQIPMETVDGRTFAKRLKATAGDEKKYIYEAFMNDMDENGRLNYETNIHIQNDFTVDYLKQLGFEWTKIDYEYIKGYVEYFTHLGYLEGNANED
jgi:amino acid adenylation domain-containing protein/thioester reductase-like protein